MCELAIFLVDINLRCDDDSPFLKQLLFQEALAAQPWVY
jgi:hypothetical protein